MLIICIGSLVLSSFTLPSSFLNSNVKYAFAQEPPATGGELLCPADFPLDVTTGLCADGFAPQSIPPSEFSQDAPLESPQLPGSTPPPEEIQMDTNGDGIVDAADNQIPSNATNTSRYTTSRRNPDGYKW